MNLDGSTKEVPTLQKAAAPFWSGSRRSRPRPSARGHLEALPATRAFSVTCLGRAIRRRCDEPRRRSERERNEEGARAASTASPAASPLRTSIEGVCELMCAADEV